MSHWAQIDENNIVINVVVGSNDAVDEGYQWLVDNIGGQWLQTSYNTSAGKHSQGGTPLRKNFAQIGYSYDEQRDAFIPPKPEPSVTIVKKNPVDWRLNEETCLWDRIVFNDETEEWDYSLITT
jgi:hypothetical protein